ncbi:MAG: HPr family phosphocarrier protein [Rhodobacteraceae bacterium]|nr:HPr family phosphocarrier protein [Paracoccaceae bacterium]MCY4197525.1 HPr family phosphocarrier protein [Paracoccaceae bacterium]
MGEVRRRFTIINEKGMHARAAAKFVEVVENHEADAEVYKDGVSAFGDSIMGLLMLAASKGTTIDVHIRGMDAESLAADLDNLISQKFHEKF